MKLGDNTLNNEMLTLVNTKFQPKYQRIVALIWIGGRFWGVVAYEGSTVMVNDKKNVYIECGWRFH